MKSLMKIILSELLYLWWLNSIIVLVLIPVIIYDGSEFLQEYPFFKAKNLAVFLIFMYLMSYNTIYIFEKRRSFLERIPLLPNMMKLDRIMTGVLYVTFIYIVFLCISLFDNDFNKWTFYEYITVLSFFVILMAIFVGLNRKIVDKDKEYTVYSNFGSTSLAVSAAFLSYGVLFTDRYLFCFTNHESYYIQSLISLLFAILIVFITILKK